MHDETRRCYPTGVTSLTERLQTKTLGEEQKQVRRAALDLTEIRARKDALHGVIGCVTIRCRARLIARGTQVIVIADQTLKAASLEVAGHTAVT